jgi:hypothetical protein
MKRVPAVLAGLALAVMTAGVLSAQDGPQRSGYSYIRDASGDVSVQSKFNGRVDARRNLPISTGDEIDVSDGGHAEIGLADGNALFVDGATRARFDSLAEQQGDEDQFSAVNLIEGSLFLFAAGDNEQQIPRIDTEDATIYLSSGARVRVNADSRRGTAVIARAGNAEVRTRAGTLRLRAGEYLLVRGDEEPQTERGAFSRDRFDIWVADRIGAEVETRSVASRYVDSQYASDVSSLDGYGDWQHNDEYGAEVWSPRVESDWSPYTNGSWYYTPVGMTWWSYDPWGWFPFHYGSWCFSAAWNRWCWRPAYVYSPAWVYWAYTPAYVGWCPTGWYSFWSPWYDNYYKNLNWYQRNNVYIAMHGVFSPRSVDFHGWNFAGTRGFGATAGRMEVIPGSRIRDRLGAAPVAVSSRPMVVPARPGQTREAIQDFVREAPRTIERTSSPTDSARFAPILARQRTLPPATLEAVQQHAVVTQRGRLAGPGIADVAPRGVRVERNRALSDIARQPASGEISRPPVAQPLAPRTLTEPALSERARVAPGVPARPEADWRTRAMESRSREALAPPAMRSDGLRTRSDTPSDTWRSRPELPPARRVIEGAVPGRRSVDSAPLREPRVEGRPEAAPPRVERAPSDGPSPRPEVHAPPPRSESRAAPPPRAESRPAPAPPPDRGRKDH